jgi:hypothetical protein
MPFLTGVAGAFGNSKEFIMKRVLRKIRALEKQGFNSQQIADLLNKQGFPVPRQDHPWDPETIARFSVKIKP